MWGLAKIVEYLITHNHSTVRFKLHQYEELRDEYARAWIRNTVCCS